MRFTYKILTALCAVAFSLAVSSCEREDRRFKETPPGASISTARQSELQPGVPLPITPSKSEYEDNAYAISEGKRLYEWFNCKGCHADGGGDIGPPLMDDKWIYGSEPANIFSTIVEGRPNGMPSFANKIPNYQLWQIVAYVRSMSGQVPKDAASGRNDDMRSKKSEQSTKKEQPKSQRAEHPQ